MDTLHIDLARALRAFRLELALEVDGVVALAGPSGAGKSTVLRTIAGLARPDKGRVALGDTVWFDSGAKIDVRPEERSVGLVFQDYALFPHMSVADNVAYGLRVQKVPKPERRTRVQEALDMVRLPSLGARKPSQLSGGQRQRVALARAIVNRPRVLLLDEPLGALDLKLRQEMQVELKRIQQEVGITFVYVTHDQEEALTMSDRLAVFNEGRIEQVGDPAEVYEHPASEFIAGFVGVSNVLERGGRRFTIRPEKVRLVEGDHDGLHTEEGVVRDVSYVGMVTRYLVDLEAGGSLQLIRQNLEETSAQAFDQRGKRVTVGWSEGQTYAIGQEGT